MSLISFGKDSKAANDARRARDAEMAGALAEIRAYWEALRKDGALPRRADIDPRGMRGALDGAFLAERIAPGVGRLRVAGRTFADLLGMDAQGMPLSAVFDPMARARLTTLLDNCFLKPAILELALSAETGIGRPALSGRMLLLPIAGDGARAEMALGCLMFSGTVGRAPRRLSITAAHSSPVQLPRLTPTNPMADLVAMAGNPAPETAATAYDAAAIARAADFTPAPVAETPFLPLRLRPLPAASSGDTPAATATKEAVTSPRPYLRLVDLGH